MLHALKVAPKLGNYADAAVLPADTDPQLYLSHNELPQPFHLVCEKDTVLSQMSGSSDVLLHGSSVNRFRMTIGDHVYVPAGTPHQIVPVEAGTAIRFMALKAGRQGAVWYCPECRTELHRYEWEHDNDIAPSRFYAAACARFSADEAARTCGSCQAVHPEIDLAAFGWSSLVPA
jgi:3-hydroxyanthranilate 3,4-dioxygenase